MSSKTCWIVIFSCLTIPALYPQSTKKNKAKIQIIYSDKLSELKMPCPEATDTLPSCVFQIFTGKVQLKKDSLWLYTDSFVINKTQKKIYAYGNIHIKDKDSLHIYSDFLSYDIAKKSALLQKNVRVDNKTQQLRSEELLYDRNKKTIDYYTGGYLLIDGMKIYSRKATYFSDSQYAFLRERVFAKDTAFELHSDSLIYNRKNKRIVFIAPTAFIQDKGLIYTQDGYYRMDSGDLFLYQKPMILNEKSVYTADSIWYNKKTGNGIASRHFSFYDTSNKFSLNSNKAVFNTKTDYFKTTERPFIIFTQKNKEKDKIDSIYLSADTIITYKTNLNALDSLKKISDSPKKENKPALNQDSARVPAYSDTSSGAGLLHHNTPPDSTHIKPKRRSSVPIKKDCALIPLPPVFDTLDQTNITHTRLDNFTDTPQKSPAPLPEKDLKINLENIGSDLRADSAQNHNPKSSEKIITSDKQTDSIQNHNPKSSEKPIPSDSLRIDSAKDFRQVIAYRKVRVYKDSLQSSCDSLAFSSLDSTIRTYYRPFLWSGDNIQFNADTINYVSEQKKLKYIVGNSNAFNIKKHKETNYYDQIKSNNILLFLDSNKIEKSLSSDSVKSIIYMPDEDEPGTYNGVNVISSDSLWIFYKNNQPTYVKYLRNISGITYPLEKFGPDKQTLPGFIWLTDSAIHPKSPYDIIDTLRYKDLKILNLSDYKMMEERRKKTPPTPVFPDFTHPPSRQQILNTRQAPLLKGGNLNLSDTLKKVPASPPNKKLPNLNLKIPDYILKKEIANPTNNKSISDTLP